MTNTTRTSFAVDLNGNVVEDQNFKNLTAQKQLQVRNYASDFLSAQESVIDSIAEFTQNANSGFVTKPLFFLNISFSYLNYRDEERLNNPNHETTLKDETSAVVNSILNNVGSGFLLTQGGLIAAATFSSAPLLATIGGAVVVGYGSSHLYDYYLKGDVNTILDFAFSGSDSITIAKDNNSQNIINYTPAPNTTLSSAQAQQKAIELLNNLSGGAILNQTPVPQKIVINSSSQAGSASSTYTIQSGDTLSQIAKSLGATTDKLIAANPFLTTENRISADGKYVLIKAGEKLSLATSEIKNSVKLEDVTLKNANGTDAGNFSNFFLDQANKTLLTNTG